MSSNDTDDVNTSRSLFEQLSLQLIEKIMNCKVLSVRDVLNVSATCTYLNIIILKNESIWKEKFFQNFSFPPDIKLEKIPTSYFNELRNACIYKKQMYFHLGSIMNYPGSALLEKKFLKEWIRLIQVEWENYFDCVDHFSKVIKNSKQSSMLSAIHAVEKSSSREPSSYMAEFSIKHSEGKIEHQSITRTIEPIKRNDEKPKVFLISVDESKNKPSESSDK